MVNKIAFCTWTEIKPNLCGRELYYLLELSIYIILSSFYTMKFYNKFPWFSWLCTSTLRVSLFLESWKTSTHDGFYETPTTVCSIFQHILGIYLFPNRHFIVQSQQWKYHNVKILFNVNNRGTLTKSLLSSLNRFRIFFLCFHC